MKWLFILCANKRQIIPMGQSKMDNREKLVDKTETNKNTAQFMYYNLYWY